MTARRKRNLLDAVLTESAAAVCVLDAERRIRLISPGMSDLVGWSADDVEGLVCEPAVSPAAPPIELLTSALAPSADVLNGHLQTVPVVLPRQDQSGVRVSLTFVPVVAADGVVSRVVVLSTRAGIGTGTGQSLTQKLHAEITALRLEFRRRFGDQSFLGNSAGIRVALAQAELLKQSDCGYSIVGPPGSGRRHLARLIHVAGRHHERSFVTLDCRLLTAEQVLDTLRRMRHGSSDPAAAVHQRVGTLLLLDAERCPREVQKWMLEDLQREAEGVRVVAAGEQSLSAAVAEGWVLPEFQARFDMLQIRLPSLHHRESDISLLAQHFIEECRRTQDTSAEGMSPDFERELMFYRWPGNVRELRHVIFDACQNSFADQLQCEDLPFAFRAGLEAQHLPQVPETTIRSLEEMLANFETDVLMRTLEACQGNKAEAARRLGMTRPRFYRRLKTLGLE
ncbi:MAG: helix-turn-helix domain-containing protein [Fuerstiella sp.]